MGKKEEVSRIEMKAIFEMDIQKMRDNKIDQIINDEKKA